MRLYLDACCWNRPFDDQSQLRVRLETAAVIAISEGAEQGRWTLLFSDALEFELTQAPDPQRRARLLRLLPSIQELFLAGPSERARTKSLRSAYKLSALDALHLACAQTLRADAFLTTDDRLLRVCRRMAAGELSFVVANPLAWLTDLSECE